jgi:myo-inositol 2-dehydrogenase/D-chiro-inositol 1-dehydrogenase
VEELASKPLGRDEFRLYGHDNLSRPERMGKIDAIANHMGNFYDCTRTRQQPISDVVSQHRSASLCHLGNIAMRIGRKLVWDPLTEQFSGEEHVVANGHLSREQRRGFEVV